MLEKCFPDNHQMFCNNTIIHNQYNFEVASWSWILLREFQIMTQRGHKERGGIIRSYFHPNKTEKQLFKWAPLSCHSMATPPPFSKENDDARILKTNLNFELKGRKLLVFNELLAFSDSRWNYFQPLAFGAQGLQRFVVWSSEDITIKDKPLSTLNINYEWRYCLHIPSFINIWRPIVFGLSVTETLTRWKPETGSNLCFKVGPSENHIFQDLLQPFDASALWCKAVHTALGFNTCL